MLQSFPQNEENPFEEAIKERNRIIYRFQKMKEENSKTTKSSLNKNQTPEYFNINSNRNTNNKKFNHDDDQIQNNMDITKEPKIEIKVEPIPIISTLQNNLQSSPLLSFKKVKKNNQSTTTKSINNNNNSNNSSSNNNNNSNNINEIKNKKEPKKKSTLKSTTLNNKKNNGKSNTTTSQTLPNLIPSPLEKLKIQHLQFLLSEAHQIIGQQQRKLDYFKYFLKKTGQNFVIEVPEDWHATISNPSEININNNNETGMMEEDEENDLPSASVYNSPILVGRSNGSKAESQVSNSPLKIKIKRDCEKEEEKEEEVKEEEEKIQKEREREILMEEEKERLKQEIEKKLRKEDEAKEEREREEKERYKRKMERYRQLLSVKDNTIKILRQQNRELRQDISNLEKKCIAYEDKIYSFKNELERLMQRDEIEIEEHKHSEADAYLNNNPFIKDIRKKDVSVIFNNIMATLQSNINGQGKSNKNKKSRRRKKRLPTSSSTSEIPSSSSSSQVSRASTHSPINLSSRSPKHELQNNDELKIISYQNEEQEQPQNQRLFQLNNISNNDKNNNGIEKGEEEIKIIKDEEIMEEEEECKSYDSSAFFRHIKQEVFNNENQNLPLPQEILTLSIRKDVQNDQPLSENRNNHPNDIESTEEEFSSLTFAILPEIENKNQLIKVKKESNIEDNYKSKKDFNDNGNSCYSGGK